MNNFIGKIDTCHFFNDIKLVDIKYINKDDYSYVFYTFIDNNGNTIIAKEKNEWVVYYVDFTCQITGNVIRNKTGEKWDDLVKVEIKNGIIYNILDKHKLTDDELLKLKTTHFGGDKRINFYNPKTYEIFCYIGENKSKKIEIGDVLNIKSIIKKHTNFKNINQTIINIKEIKII